MGDPLAIAVSASGDEAVPVDSAGVGLYPAIMSMDVRSLEEGRLYAETVGAERLYRLTGLPVVANWPLVRLMAAPTLAGGLQADGPRPLWEDLGAPGSVPSL